MRDPTTTKDTTKWLIEVTVQYLCERDLLETCEVTRDANVDVAFGIKFAREIMRLGLRPPARRKRGRPPQQRDRHLQIAGAVQMLVKDYDLEPTRSHFLRWRSDPSACSIVTAALERAGEILDDYLGGYWGKPLKERAVEDIWNDYQLLPEIFHQGATDYARTHRDRVEDQRRHLDAKRPG
jgi:hypothetical protein